MLWVLGVLGYLVVAIAFARIAYGLDPDPKNDWGRAISNEMRVFWTVMGLIWPLSLLMGIAYLLCLVIARWIFWIAKLITRGLM
jgi:hypothetical protein